MTEQSCPIPTPAQRLYADIQHRAMAEMLQSIDAAIRKATDRARRDMEIAGLDEPPPERGFFIATAHQQLFCLLCGADPETFAGGRAEIAAAVLRNGRNIARHYWGADQASETV